MVEQVRPLNRQQLQRLFGQDFESIRRFELMQQITSVMPDAVVLLQQLILAAVNAADDALAKVDTLQNTIDGLAVPQDLGDNQALADAVQGLQVWTIPNEPAPPYVGPVANLPAVAEEGATAYATDGLKVGETTGNGTGVPVYYSGGWLVYSTDTAVQT